MEGKKKKSSSSRLLEFTEGHKTNYEQYTLTDKRMNAVTIDKWY